VGVRFFLAKENTVMNPLPKICLTVLALAVSALGNSSVRPLLNAIRQVESACRPADRVPPGDGGRSIGPFQIQWRYWHDASVPGRYSDVRNVEYAEKVMLAYWSRHCPQALARGDWKTLARIHNGGPQGPRNPATMAYWKRVAEALRRK
jgi:hypothetical protein